MVVALPGILALVDIRAMELLGVGRDDHTVVARFEGQEEFVGKRDGLIQLRIPVKLDSDSSANCSPVPAQADQLLERSDAGISLLVGMSSLGQLFLLFSH